MSSISVKEWNDRYPPGTPVTYHPVVPFGTLEPFETKTRSPAWDMGAGYVVLVEGKTGGVAISHLVVKETSTMKTIKTKTTVTTEKSFELSAEEVEDILIQHCLKLLPDGFKNPKASVHFDIYGEDMLRSASVYLEKTVEED